MSDLAKALAAFQSAVPRIDKGKTAKAGTFSYRYADLADVVAAVMPALGKVGLSFTARPTLDEHNRFVLAYALMHEGGEKLEGFYPLPAANTPAQQLGSALTYGRRYCLLAVTGVAPDDEDDDGKQAAVADPYPSQEHFYDAADQEQLREAFERDIDKASSVEDLLDIGRRVQAAQAKPVGEPGSISPNTYRRLSQYAGKRRAEINGMPTALAVDEDPQPLPDQPPVKALTRLHALCGEVGLDRAARLAFMSEQTGRSIASSNDLTAAEVDVVVKALEQRKRQR